MKSKFFLFRADPKGACYTEKQTEVTSYLPLVQIAENQPSVPIPLKF